MNDPTDGLSPPRILLAEDDHDMRVMLAHELRRLGYDVIECSDGQSLVSRLACHYLDHVTGYDVDLVISDVRMPACSGLDILDGMHGREAFPPMILITAFGDAATHARAEYLGAVAMLDKPFPIRELLDVVRATVGAGRG